MKKKANKKKIYNAKNNIEYGVEIKKLAIILGIIILILGILYLIVSIFITKDFKLFSNNKTENTPVESTIQYSEILAGETFNRKESEYYVIFSDSTKNYYQIYKTMMDGQTDKKIYMVDIKNPLNTAFISDETNPNVQKASDLKVKDNTMIKISNGKNVSYIEDKNQILSYFN